MNRRLERRSPRSLLYVRPTKQLRHRRRKPRFEPGDPVVNVRRNMKYVAGTILAVGRSTDNRIWNMIEWEDGTITLTTDDNRHIVHPQRG